MKFVLVHGSFGSPEGAWLPQLAEQLRALGQDVLSPQFPVDTWDQVTKNGPGIPLQNQRLEAWLDTLGQEIKSIQKNDKVCFVGHSLGCVFTLHAVLKFNLFLDSAIFVSPFLEHLGKLWQIDLANTSFYKTDFDFQRLKKHIPLSYALFSDNDPYVDEHFAKDFSDKMGSSPVFVRRAGHMNGEVDLIDFPLVLELCKSRLDLSLHQKYVAHRRELYSVDYTGTGVEEVIYLEPKEIFDEGVFHFRNMRKSGFSTFYTGIKEWDTQSRYFEEARKAAKRIPIHRVFIFDTLKDLARPIIQEQIQRDLDSGMKISVCPVGLISDRVTEYDFGIWDDDYVCMVHSDNQKKIHEVKLTSRKIDLENAHTWRDLIVDFSTEIHSLDDLKELVTL